ncbi:MAG TPA: hypothetical protein VL379_16455 [Pseudomonadales bacterium]|jgi:hypothetical protein|nr:hypothetical protein [Pseudomonadales bacterium]
MAGEIEEDEDDYDMPLSEEDLDDFESDGAEEEEGVVLDPRERAARSLEIRRAIESRIEERKMRSDLDYLEVDDDAAEDDDADE